jgi:hypothetical protein
MPLAPLGRLVLPGAKAAEKRVCVVAYAASGGQLVEVLYIASAQHHVIGLERGDEMHDHVFDMLPPFLLAVSGQPPQANVVLVGAIAIGQMPGSIGSMTPSTIIVDPSPVPKPRNSILPPL